MPSSPAHLSLRQVLLQTARMGLFPLALYLFFYCIFTWPIVLFFNTHFFTDNADGMGSVWGLWWVNHALTKLGQSPWHTPLLHHPFGISLWGTSPILFNGLLAIPLLKFLTLVQTHNTILVFGFVMGGTTAFWLAHTLTRSYWPSLIAGFIFTFSSYHFAHALGHLNLVSLEWIPLFVLFWYLLVTQPRILWGAAAALFLYTTFLCDFYYMLVCFLSACIIALWRMIQKKDFFLLLRREYWLPLSIFLILATSTTGASVFVMVCKDARDYFVADCGMRVCGGIKDFSMDLLAPFIYGGIWRYAHWTSFYWSRLSASIAETSCHFGLAVLFLVLYVWFQRRKSQIQDMGLWYLLVLFFAVIALGPVLHIAGHEFSRIVLPFALLQKIFPPLHMARTPARLIVMATLGISIISAIGFRMLFHGTRPKQWLAMGLLILLFFETWPRGVNVANFTLAVPSYVKTLAKLPGKEPVIDVVSPPGLMQYYQTTHKRPLAFGAIARYPLSIYKKNLELLKTISEHHYADLYSKYGFRYLVIRDSALPPHPAIIFRDGDTTIIDLGRC